MDIIDLKSYPRGSTEGRFRDLLILGITFGFVFLLFLGSSPLIDPDEGRYAEIPREMLERGDFITPTLNYVKYFEKPPLLYWLNAASIRLFGQNEFAARIPSALSGLLTVLVTYLAAHRLYGRRAAILAALILGTSTGFVFQSRIILTDMLLTFCLSACLFAFIVAAERGRDRKTSWYLFYLFAALAVLTKGLIGLVFPGAIIFLYLLFGSKWSLLRKMRLPTGILLFLAIVSPWFIAVSLSNPEFAHFFFIREHFQRFTSTVHGRYQPFWFFLPILLATMLPWSFFIPQALARGWRERHGENGSAGLFLLLWAALIFLFFSKSSSKLIPYILPIFPALAVLIAAFFDDLMEQRPQVLKPAACLLGMVLVILGAAALLYPQLPEAGAVLKGALPAYTSDINRAITSSPSLPLSTCVTIGMIFLFQGLFSFIGATRRTAIPLVVSLCLCSFLLSLLAPRLVMHEVARSESPRELALAAKSRLTQDSVIATLGPMQGVSWYTGQRLITVGKPDELEFGSQQGDQSRWFLDLDRFTVLWGGERPLLAMMRKFEFEALRPRLVPPPMLVRQAGRHVLISNR